MNQERCDTGNGGITYFYRYPARRRLAERRLADAAGAGPLSPFTFGLTMSISNRTLRIRSNTIPREEAPAAPPADAAEPVSSFDKGSGGAPSSRSPVAVVAGVAGAAVVAAAALMVHRRRSAVPEPEPAPEPPAEI